MKPVKIVIASSKKLIVQSIANSIAKDTNAHVLGMVSNVEVLIEYLQTQRLEILIIDQQILEELFVWKNIHPKSINRTLKVLLITSEKYTTSKNELPGFYPNQVTFWEKGMEDLLVCFKLLQENKFLQLKPIDLQSSLVKKGLVHLN